MFGEKKQTLDLFFISMKNLDYLNLLLMISIFVSEMFAETAYWFITKKQISKEQIKIYKWEKCAVIFLAWLFIIIFCTLHLALTF